MSASKKSESTKFTVQSLPAASPGSTARPIVAVLFILAQLLIYPYSAGSINFSIQ